MKKFIATLTVITTLITLVLLAVVNIEPLKAILTLDWQFPTELLFAWGMAIVATIAAAVLRLFSTFSTKEDEKFEETDTENSEEVAVSQQKSIRSVDASRQRNMAKMAYYANQRRGA